MGSVESQRQWLKNKEMFDKILQSWILFPIESHLEACGALREVLETKTCCLAGKSWVLTKNVGETQ